MDIDAHTDPASQVAVLLPAAGRGVRMGGKRKQFRMLGERPLLVQTLMAFERHPEVDHIIVVSPTGEVSETTDLLQAQGLHKLTAVVSGGDSRQASVANALRAVPAPVDITLVHDAVRPFIDATRISNVIEAVRTVGAASLAIPLGDTLREGDGEWFGKTVPRDSLYRMQTPQGFMRSWLERAHREVVGDDDVDATDDVDLVQRIGHDVRIVLGSTQNFKVTTPEDWALAQELWPYWVEHHVKQHATE